MLKALRKLRKKWRRKKGKYSSIYPRVVDHKISLSEAFFPEPVNQVRSGPFAGMNLVKFGTQTHSDYVAKILGQYELELHPFIRKAVDQNPDCVINIGSADGYYSVGLKRLHPAADVYAYDIDPAVGEGLAKNCHANSVDVRFSDKFEWGYDDKYSGYKRPFFFVDIEGDEENLIRLSESLLQRSSFLIELHDLFRPGVTDKLTSFLGKTHSLHIIEEQGRNPNQFPELSRFGNFDRYLLLIELRGGPQQWLYAEPK